jgi:hypothetical protein
MHRAAPRHSAQQRLGPEMQNEANAASTFRLSTNPKADGDKRRKSRV